MYACVDEDVYIYVGFTWHVFVSINIDFLDF